MVPYEVQYPDGIIVRVPTYEEAVRLRREAAAELSGKSTAARGRAPATPDRQPSSDETPWAKVRELVLKPEYEVEHKLLAAVKGRKSVSTSDLQRALGLKHPGALGARIAGVGRICKAAGVEKEELLVREGSIRKGFALKAGPLLAANELPPVPVSKK